MRAAAIILAALPVMSPPVLASGVSARSAADAFAAHCFSPFLTAQTAAARLAPARIDFYDLTPLSGGAVSPARGRPVTAGTDRRCEVAFDGADVAAGVAGAVAGLSREGIDTEATVPAAFPVMSGTEFVAARRLNPARVAVVQVGTRPGPGPSGVETFVNVERLVPELSR